MFLRRVGSDVELIEMYQGGAEGGFHSPLARRLLYQPDWIGKRSQIHNHDQLCGKI